MSPCPRFLVFSCLLTAGAAPAATIRVPGDAQTIQAAIDEASPQDLILVSPGEYFLSEPIFFRGKAITVRSESGPEATTLRRAPPSDPGSVVIFDAAEGSDTVLQGFTVTGGTGTAAGESTRGGGIVCRGGSRATIEDLVIKENRATHGGGLYCLESSPTLIGCTLARNHADSGGGAFLDASGPIFIRCTIQGNRGVSAGAGVHCENGSTPSLESCRILGGASSQGGGVDSFGSFPELQNCIIAGNHAESGGGAFVAGGSSMKLVNCTIAGNSAVSSGDISSITEGATIQNCIFWDNAASLCPGWGTTCLVAEDPSFVRRGLHDFTRFTTIKIQDVDCEFPDFIVEEPDLHLRSGSPGIDAGTISGAPSADIDGAPRPSGHGVDIGAYEMPNVPFRRGDPNGDGTCDIGDPIFVLRALFGLSASRLDCEESCDSNDDGDVDISDPVLLLLYLFVGNVTLAEPTFSCGSDATPDRLTCESYAACVTVPETALGRLAAAMAPGTWAELETDNLVETFLSDGLGGAINGYAEDGAWDPASEQFLFLGGDHLGPDSVVLPRFVAYSAATNAWSILPQPYWVTAYNMHAYDHNAINPETGEFYHRASFTRQVYKYSIRDAFWTPLPVIPESVMGYNNGCMALEYFPEMGGLVFAGSTTLGSVTSEVYFFNQSAQLWSCLGSDSPMGGYENFVEYNPVHKVVIFGGGGDPAAGTCSRKMYKLSGSGEITPLGDAPMCLGVQAAIVTVDPAGGDFIVLGSGGEAYSYDVIDDVWSPLSSTPPIFSPTRGDNLLWESIAAPVSTYGVILFVKFYWAAENSMAWAYLYKHD